MHYHRFYNITAHNTRPYPTMPRKGPYNMESPYLEPDEPVLHPVVEQLAVIGFCVTFVLILLMALSAAFLLVQDAVTYYTHCTNVVRERRRQRRPAYRGPPYSPLHSPMWLQILYGDGADMTLPLESHAYDLEAARHGYGAVQLPLDEAPYRGSFLMDFVSNVGESALSLTGLEGLLDD